MASYDTSIEKELRGKMQGLNSQELARMSECIKRKESKTETVVISPSINVHQRTPAIQTHISTSHRLQGIDLEGACDPVSLEPSYGGACDVRTSPLVEVHDSH
jgi:hypothetical protein